MMGTVKLLLLARKATNLMKNHPSWQVRIVMIALRAAKVMKTMTVWRSMLLTTRKLEQVIFATGGR
jgi:hypothetical protein